MAVKRVTRIEQSAENRERVLAAARSVFTRKGFHAASVDEIAEEAGFSKGVVYSQFGGKDDLFLALLERRIEQRRRENLETVRRATEANVLAALFEAAQRATRSDQAWTLLVLEFRLHAARDPELLQRYAALHERTVAGIAEAIAAMCEKMGAHPSFTPDELARFIIAVDNGSVLELLTAPRAFTSRVAQAATRYVIESTGTTDGRTRGGIR